MKRNIRGCMRKNRKRKKKGKKERDGQEENKESKHYGQVALFVQTTFPASAPVPTEQVHPLLENALFSLVTITSRDVPETTGDLTVGFPPDVQE